MNPAPRGWKPKLVALDVDGTLLAWATGRGGTIEHLTDPVRDAIADAVAAGTTIVLASGRSIHAMLPVLETLGLGNPEQPVWAVAANGAVVFRYPPLEVVHEETFDARPAVSAILAKHPDVLVAVEERGVGYRLTQHFPPGELDGDMIIVEDPHALIAEPVSRVIIRDPDASVEDFVALTEGLGLHGTNYVVGWTAWLDLAPVGVDKASGLAIVCERLGVAARDVLAMGDGRNDLEMLAWAGRGVAMGQAIPEVQELADAVTGTVDDDGVATELRRYFGTGLHETSPLRPPLPDLVSSSRFHLPLITEADAIAMRAGRRAPTWHPDYPREDDLDAVGFVRDGNVWGPRHIVRIFDGQVFGSVGFFGRPDDVAGTPEVEIGFGLVAEARRRGVTSEILAELLAHTDSAGVRVRASVEPGNLASIRLLTKAGFTQLRGSDGAGLLVMVRPIPID